MGITFSQIAIQHSLMYNKEVIKKQEEIKRERIEKEKEKERERREREELAKEDNCKLNEINKVKFYKI